MAEKLNVVTGPTGLLGSHIVEQLVAKGERVRALVRPTSDTSFLRQLGVELAIGDLQEVASLRQAVTGADLIYHCAARVSDWGPWRDFETETVHGTRNLVEACQAARAGRILHISSISVYGHVKNPVNKLTEDSPLGQNLWMWDHYARSKILAEDEIRKYADYTIVRPSWIYGPRDRVTIPRVAKAMRLGNAPLVGKGDNLLNIVYAGDVAEGAILAANYPQGKGQAFNLCSEGEITQRKLVDTMCDALSVPRLTKQIPLFVAFQFAFMSEVFGKLFGKKTPPRVTRRAVYLIARPTQFSTQKARTQLGWQPHVGIDEGISRSLVWFFDYEKNLQKTPVGARQAVG